MQTIERALAIERRRDERAIYLRERTVIELLPSLGGEFGHPCGNATCGLDRLVASPHSTGRRVAGPDYRFGQLFAERQRIASRPALDRPSPHDVDGTVLVRGAEIDRDALVDVSSRT